MIKEELTNLVSEMRRFAEVLKEYGQHKKICNMAQFWAGRIVPELIDTSKCTCGYEQALAWADCIENLQKLNDEKIQALQLYLEHKHGCPAFFTGNPALDESPDKCTCGLASLTQPGAANKTKVSEE